MIRTTLRHSFYAALGLIVVLMAANSQAADTYKIDPAHSAATFAVRHMVISTVRGSIPAVTGTIVLDTEEPSACSVHAVLDPASIDTDNKTRDADLKSANFLDVDKFPKLEFVSTRVEHGKDGWVAYGKLTLHGVTKEIALSFDLSGPVKDPWGNTRIGVGTSPIKLDRKDYGLSYNKTLDSGGLVVGDEVTITISVEATKTK